MRIKVSLCTVDVSATEYLVLNNVQLERLAHDSGTGVIASMTLHDREVKKHMCKKLN